MGLKARDTEETETKKKNIGKKSCGAETQRRLLAKRWGDSGSLTLGDGSPAPGRSAPSNKTLPETGLIELRGAGGMGDGGKLIPAKRNRDSDSSTPREVKKKSIEVGQPTYSESVATPLSIVFIPQSYPENSEEQGKLVLASVENAMDEAPEDSYFPSFLNNWFWRRARVFHSRTQEDVKWLMETVGGCVLWEDAILKAVEMGDLQKLVRVLIFVPGKHEAGSVLKRHSRQKPDLKVDTWQVRGSKKSDLGIETAVLVTMECTEVEVLKRIDVQP